MLRIAMVSAVVLASAAVSRGGFSMSHTRSSIDSTHDRITLKISNDGVGSGSNTVAVDLGGYGIPAATGGSAGTYWFNTAATGVAKPFDGYGAVDHSAVRLSSDPTTQYFLASQSPSSWGSASTASLNNWGVVYISLSLPATLNNNTNFEFASLVVDKGAGMHFDARTAGTTGPAFGLTYDVPSEGGSGSGLDITGTGNALAGTSGGNSYFIGVNSGAGNRGESSLTPNAAPNVTLSLVGDLQKAVQAGATITPSNGGLLVNFDHPAAGAIYNLTFRATDALTGGTTVETLALRGVAGVAPEPVTLASMLLGAPLLLRRRK